MQESKLGEYLLRNVTEDEQRRAAFFRVPGVVRGSTPNHDGTHTDYEKRDPKTHMPLVKDAEGKVVGVIALGAKKY